MSHEDKNRALHTYRNVFFGAGLHDFHQETFEFRNIDVIRGKMIRLLLRSLVITDNLRLLYLKVRTK